MNLLHPWYLAGLAAIGLPVAVHFLTRPRPRVLPLSTVRFVREAVQQRRARHRLRDWIVLLLRGLAVALLALAFARPLVGAKKVTADEGGNSVRVVILDQSQSMAAVSNGIASFERARTAAASHLGYAPGLQANLILAAARPRGVFPSPSTNFGAMRDALASAQPRGESLNLKAAIDAAGEMLAKTAPERRRELIVVSDFQRSNWATADFSPLPKDTVIRLESVAPSQPPANLAILRAGAQGRVEQGRESKLEVEVGNYSPTPRQVQVELSVGGASYRLSGHCPPHATVVLSADAVLSTTGWQAGEARLVGAQDALAADDVRSFVVDVRPPLTYLLITRDPATPHVSASQFLERALVPFKRPQGQGERVVRGDPDALDREAVAGADVIVLDHPGRLSSESMKLLASVVRRGRALLYVTAEPTDASNLSLLADAAGSDLKMPVRFVPPAQGAPRDGLFIASTRANQSVFGIFGENLGAAISPLRFGGGLDSQKLDTGLSDDVLATYSDRTACLILTACGAGRIAVLNADLGQSNLAVSPVFVPLLGEVV
ncbi:MAG TPA: BatA and WFA domain-containing protein, partial [Tepidisphaeraceae bacterium]|nr:BatA and WFA domain-containing protein [Tepidisphaeraceae bacterium]